MIKKIALLCAVFMIVAMPCVLADAAPYIRPAEGEYVNISAEYSSEKVQIGTDFKCTVNIENLNNRKIYLTWLSLGSVSYDLKEYIPEGEEHFMLKPHETVELEVSGLVYTERGWYRKDDGFYLDFQLKTEFYIEKDIEENYYWEESDVVTAMKIVNMYDDPGYVSLRFNDSRETLYLYDEFTDSDIEGVEHLYYGGRTYAEIECTNLSNFDVDIIKPNESYVYIDSFYCKRDVDSLEEKVSYTYDFVHEVDGNYYVSSIDREYDTALLHPPEIDLVISKVIIDEEEFYKFIISNPNDYNIENLYFVSERFQTYTEDEKYFKHGTLNTDETWEIISPVSDDFTSLSMITGYIIDDLIYIWHIDSDFPDVAERELKPATFYENYSYLVDYKAERERYLHEVYKNHDMEQNAEETETHEIAEYTPVPTDEIEDTGIAFNAEVVSKRNNMLWAMIVIGVLICGAVAVIVLSMKKIIKNRQNEEKDD